MTVTELLETVRRVEVRTNCLVNDTLVGAYLSHFRGRGVDFEKRRTFHPEEPVHPDAKPLEFERFRYYGEFAIIKSQAGEAPPILIPSNSTELEFKASATNPD